MRGYLSIGPDVITRVGRRRFHLGRAELNEWARWWAGLSKRERRRQLRGVFRRRRYARQRAAWRREFLARSRAQLHEVLARSVPRRPAETYADYRLRLDRIAHNIRARLE